MSMWHGCYPTVQKQQLDESFTVQMYNFCIDRQRRPVVIASLAEDILVVHICILPQSQLNDQGQCMI